MARFDDHGPRSPSPSVPREEHRAGLGRRVHCRASLVTDTHDQILTGWGNYPKSRATVRRPESLGGLRAGLAADSTIARGLGRSYADQALNAGASVIDCTAYDRFLGFDETTGTLRCEAGTSLRDIIAAFAPRGFFPMVTPGTKFVTVGGCIANDVHGKGHHVDGCFSRCVDSFQMMLANGELVTLSREQDPELFWACFGGLGLLGVITEATIRLRPIETTWFRQTAMRVRNLDELLEAFETHDDIPYAVAWVDPRAKGSSLGRGVLTMGDHAKRSELPPELADKALHVSGDPKINVPFQLPSFSLNAVTAPVLNRVLDVVQSRAGAFAHYEKFFYPLDFVGHWNRSYGARGFTQYQFVVPLDGGAEAMRSILQRIATSNQLPFLNVLKKLGAEEGILSFPIAGYTFAIDFPIRPGLDQFLRELDDMVVQAGGRVYLGKDAFVDAATLAKMYPRLDEWKAIKKRVDPDRRFCSDLGRRVGLC